MGYFLFGYQVEEVVNSQDEEQMEFTLDQKISKWEDLISCRAGAHCVEPAASQDLTTCR